EDGIDWASKDMPKLWRYNLHYFDYLFDAGRSHDSKVHLISDWIAKNPPGTGDAWEPYTLSLRIVNWIKLFLKRDAAIQEAWVQSLYTQTLWLEKNVEYHLLANHYLKNGVALFFAGVYFEGVDADRWIKKGLKILREELGEQFLADGGHFERSPMYHSICVIDYLDVLNLAQNSQAVLPAEETVRLRHGITASLKFLHDICLPDSEIPLFNDSAFGIAPTPRQIFDYARSVTGYEPPPKLTGLAIHEKLQSGYYVCRDGEDMIMIDCGFIGPDYQSGHAHCDTLSYELAINGLRVIVDSGVYDYEPSAERAYARSTRAHNTVVVDGEDQSEMWGVFRVARRAKPLRAFFEKQLDGSVVFEGAHDGYARLPGKPIHKRQMSFDGQGSWVVTDMLEGKGTHRMESYIHIHPDFEVVQSETGIRVVEPNGSTMAIIEALGPSQMRTEQGWYFPEFGLKRENHVIVFTCSGKIPLSLSYRIRKVTSQKQ
ncbi:MAG: alginate lyase family protein, partial [Nitrospirota bacterium]